MGRQMAANAIQPKRKPASPHCQVRRETSNVVLAGRNTARALRRLHRALKHCQDCLSELDENTTGCPLRQPFSEQINEVIAEINAEWEVEL